MIEVVNRQRRLKVDTQAWTDFCRKGTRAQSERADRQPPSLLFQTRLFENSISSFAALIKRPMFCRSLLMDQTNRILVTLPSQSKPPAAQAKENGLTFDEEIAQLILHGLLHLSGYDHETDNGEMNRLELKLRRKLGI